MQPWPSPPPQRTQGGHNRVPGTGELGKGLTEPVQACSEAGRAELSRLHVSGCRMLQHQDAPESPRERPARGHLRPNRSLGVFVGPDSSRKGLGTGEMGDVVV